MGHKVHPGGLRVGVIHEWKSNWYTGSKEFPEYLIEDVKIRDHIQGKLGHAGISDILIRKDKQRITVDIYTARPGIVIGKSGVEVDALRKELHAITQKNVHININEIKRPELEAEAAEEDEAPKPKRAPRTKAAETAETTEEKAKPKRAPRKKAETGEAEEKPKPKRAPRKKAEPKASTDKPKTTPKKKTEES